MRKFPSDRARKTATKLSAETFKRDADVVMTVKTALAEDGRTLHCFVAADRKSPNGPRHVAIVDDDGTEVDVKALSADVSRSLGAGIVATGSITARPIAGPGTSASIDPTSNDLVLELGETEIEIVTVTIPAMAGVSKADVYLLADTTGSMEPVINAVKAGANLIVGANYGGLDIAFGVGNYRDLPGTNPPFAHQLSPDTTPANVIAAVNAWTAADGAGGDASEAQLFALHMLGEGPGGAIGWRPDSKRIIVWFGDAPGHDPICQAMSGLGFDITEASATSRLVNAPGGPITVVAISTDTGFVPDALDGDPAFNAGDYNGTCAIGGAAGQATRIAAATGGTFVSGINAGGIVDTIIDLIESAVLDIDKVTLEPTAAVAPFVDSISPASYGPLPGDEQHVLPFKVAWRGVRPCGEEDAVVTGGLNAVADGSVIARKPVRITIPACPPEFVYAVKYICGVAADCGCPDAPVRPGRYATEINIHNPSRFTAAVDKIVTPTVTAGIGVGREPRRGTPANRDRIKLQPHEATMDDCRRLAELHYGAPAEGQLPLTIGFLEIVSTQELVVTAVYTATGADGGLTMDIETVRPIVRPQLPSRDPTPRPG